MAQFEILSLQFPTPQEGNISELAVLIDNPEGMVVLDVEHDVPNDVEIVQPGEEPTQDLWVFAENFHLTITLKSGTGVNPFEVLNTSYYNQGSGSPKELDVVIAEEDEGEKDKKKTRKIRRKGIIVF